MFNRSLPALQVSMSSVITMRLMVGGALGCLCGARIAFTLPLSALAQVTPDGTLGPEASVVVPDTEVRGVLADRIDGGAMRGANLFHSFSEFNIDEGQRVYFGNPIAVEHIFSRVTGANASNLFGTLGVDGPADLFFINPNGIVFGENANLDIEGAFVGTTAGSFQFADGSEFGAVLAAGGDLLTVSVPLGLQYGPTPTGNVINDGDLSVGPGQELTLFGDTVVHRGSLSTAGGTVNVLGNQVALLGTATVDVSGATGGGNVFIGGDLQGQGPRPTAQITYVEPEVTLNASAIDSGNGGQIIVWAEDATYFAGAIAARGGNGWGDGGFVEVSGRQFLDYRGQTDTQAPNGAIGTLLLDPTNIAVVADPGETLDLGQVNEFGIPDIGGDGVTELGVGAINAAESNVVLQALQDIAFFVEVDIGAEGVGLTARAGNGIGVFAPLITNGGDIELIAGDATSGVASEDAIILIEAEVLSNGGDLLLQSSQDALVNGAIVATSAFNGQGVGNLLINVVENFTVINGGQINVSTVGEGDAGDLIIQANEIDLIGVSPIDGSPSGLFADVLSNATGTGGDIDISNVSRLSILDGAELSASTFGEGDAGDLIIQANEIDLVGVNPINGAPSGLFASVESTSTGAGGNIDISNVSRLSVSDGATISASTFGEGDAGDLIVQTNEIDLVGVNPINGSPSGLFARVESTSTGAGGNIDINNVSRLSVSDGAEISATTFGEGDAGDLIIQANEIDLVGGNPINGAPSGLFVTVQSNATGTGGDIDISNVSRLSVLNGAELSASTFGTGNGGTLSIKSERIEVSGSDNAGNPSLITAEVGPGAIGNAQTLTLNAQQLLLQDGGQIRVSTFGEGNAGDLIIQANEIDLVGDNPIRGTPSGLFANVDFFATGTGGDIDISNVSRLSVLDGAALSASTFGTGNGGTLSIKSERIEVSGSDNAGNPSLITAEVGPGAIGNAQTLTLDAQQLLLQDGGQINVSTFGEGNAGNLIIQANEIDLVGVNLLDGDPSGLFANVGSNATGTGGDINISNVSRLFVSDGADLSASTLGTGGGGTLSIEADRIEVSGSDDAGNVSSITVRVASGAIGNAQTLTLDAQQLLLQEGGQIGVSTFGAGNAGDLTIQANEIDLVGVNPIRGTPSGLFANVDFFATGTGGDIKISNVSRLSVLDGAEISATTLGEGNSGTLSIEADRIEVSGSDDEGNVSLIAAQVRQGAMGNAQTLTLNAQQLLLQEGGQISVSTFGEGDAGDLIIQSNEIDLVGVNPINGFPSALFARVESNATGTGGNINISNVSRLSVSDGAELSATTFGEGDAGDLIIQANEIDLVGINPIDGFPSGLFVTVQSNATGTGGDININNVSRLSVLDGAQLSATTSGAGNAGTVSIEADRIEVSGSDDKGNLSLITAQVASGAMGNAQTLTLDAQQLLLQEGGQISVSTFGDGNAGDLIIQANEIDLVGVNPIIGFPSALFARVEPNATGTGGDINISNVSRLSVLDGARLSADTLGAGNGGTLSIEADQIEVSGSDDEGNFSAITAQVRQRATGDAQTLTLDTQQLLLQEGGQISVSTLGEGNAGDLIIQANAIELLGANPIDGTPSGLSAAVDSDATGTGGDINISNVDRLSVSGGAELSASTLGQGDSGTVFIGADRIEVSGSDNQGKPSTIATQVGEGATGNAQTLTLDAGVITVLDGALISVQTLGDGDAGDLTLSASDIQLVGDETEILAATSTDSKAGSIQIEPTAGETDVAIAFQEGATISAETSGNQIGGDIILTAPNAITLSGNGSISARSTGEADAGSLLFMTDQLTLTDGINATVSSIGDADSGTLTIETRTLALENQAQLIAETEAGIGGEIDIDVTDRVSLNQGSRISASTQDGQGGEIDIDTATLAIRDESGIAANTTGQGEAGQIAINATDSIALRNNSNISSAVERGATGDANRILLQTPDLSLRNGSQISSSTNGTGNPGIIRVQNAQGNADRIFLNNSSITTAVRSNGEAEEPGNINLQTNRLILTNESAIRATTGGQGDAGIIRIPTADRIILDNSSISTAVRSGATNSDSGTIRIGVRSLSLTNNSRIVATTNSDGSAGRIRIKDAADITLDNSQISTVIQSDGSVNRNTDENTDDDPNEQQRFGTIAIDTASLDLNNNAQISSSTAGRGDAGRINIDASDAIRLAQGSRITTDVRTDAIGNAERISFNTPELFLSSNSQISATTDSQGNPGTIRVQDADRIILNNSRITTAIGSEANAKESGNIILQTDRLRLTNDSEIQSTTSGQGNAGLVRIPAANRIILDGSSISTATETGATASESGTIQIGTRSLSLTNASSITASTNSNGSAGQIRILDADDLTLDNSQISTEIGAEGVANSPGGIRVWARLLSLDNRSSITASTEGVGDAGDIVITGDNLEMGDNSAISSRSTFDPNNDDSAIDSQRLQRFAIQSRTTDETSSNAGNITIRLTEDAVLTGSDITTEASAFAGGDIVLNARDIRLRGNSDITTNVQSGPEGGGDIRLQAETILAFDDSDIISSASEGSGGNIILATPVLLGEKLQVNAPGETNLNDRVDINATGAVNGVISSPDVNFIQNSLNNLPEGVINTESLIANSCVVQNEDGSSTFIITGAEGLGDRPGNLSTLYPTGDIQAIPDETIPDESSWQPGDPVIEAQEVYQLPNGELVISHSCS
ncbi:MAG: filamentous hemagglutinin N-terminal domain-containing protein [Cyanobacteria bacterium P01_F01_bin.150]